MDTATEKDIKTDKIKATKRALRYFQEVELSNVRRLYNIFKPDFDLFQYSADEFFWSQQNFMKYMYIIETKIACTAFDFIFCQMLQTKNFMHLLSWVATNCEKWYMYALVHFSSP